MALLFMDSFDHVGNNGPIALKKWDVSSGGLSIDNTIVRTGSGALSLFVSTQLTKLVTPGDVFIVGLACYPRNRPISGNNGFLDFREGATTHIAINSDSSGFLVVKRDTTVLATATNNPIAINGWTYIEVKVVIHDTAGSVVVHVDGNLVTFNASLTGIDTRNGATGNVDSIVLNGNATQNLTIDDLYICDDAGSVNNDFLGVCVIERLLPQTTTPGDLNDFTCSTGTDHGALVDDNPPNDDTDYTSGDTVGQQDSYHYPSLALTGAILGIQTNLYARKTDAGARTVAALVRIASTTYPGAAVAPTTSFKYFPEVREINPNTGIAWTSADVAALQAGMKIVS